MVLHKRLISIGLVHLLLNGCGQHTEYDQNTLLSNACNNVQLKICLDHEGGQACYEKWNCSKSGIGEIPTQAKVYKARGTAYYPDNSTLEGGFYDRLGKPLQTLQDHLAGKASYVSVAMDMNAFPYGTKLRIPELEKKYQRLLEFRVVDTGSAFQGKGTSRIDVCVINLSASYNATINGPLTLVVE